MRVGILGSGLMGTKLGTLFARAGHEVAFSYARGHEKLKALARDTGSKACAGSPREAAGEADAILLAVHLAPHRRRLKLGRRPDRQGHRHLLSADERRQ